GVTSDVDASRPVLHCKELPTWIVECNYCLQPHRVSQGRLLRRQRLDLFDRSDHPQRIAGRSSRFNRPNDQRITQLQARRLLLEKAHHILLAVRHVLEAEFGLKGQLSGSIPEYGALNCSPQSDSVNGQFSWIR